MDEKLFKKVHKYCTILTDSTNKRTLEIVPKRTKESAKTAIAKSLSAIQQKTWR